LFVGLSVLAKLDLIRVPQRPMADLRLPIVQMFVNASFFSPDTTRRSALQWVRDAINVYDIE